METKFLEFTQQFLLKVHVHAKRFTKVGILFDLEDFVSFVGVRILGQGPLPVTIKKAVGWSLDQNHITFTFQHGRQSCRGT